MINLNPNTSPHIIVKRAGRYDVRDFAVFTGQITLETTQVEFLTGALYVMGRGEISEDIDHAFIFSTAFQAVQWSQRLMPDWDEQDRKFVPFTWCARKFPDFTPGEYNPRSVALTTFDAHRALGALQQFEREQREINRRESVSDGAR